MRKLNLAVGAIFTIIIASIWIPSMVLRNANAATTEYKIGVVNLDVATMEYDYRKEEVERYRIEFKGRSDEIEGEYQILRDRRDSLRNQTTSSTMEKRFELQLEIEDDFHSLQQKLNRLDADQARAQERLELKISHDIQSVLDAIAFEENYHLILAAREGSTNGVIYASTTINMTQKLIDRLNEIRSPQN